jgi:integrase
MTSRAYDQLLDAAKAVDVTTYLAVLLGGGAVLRCGELMALEWRDVDLANRRLCVARSEWKGQITATKGGRIRYVPLDSPTRFGVIVIFAVLACYATRQGRR